LNFLNALEQNLDLTGVKQRKRAGFLLVICNIEGNAIVIPNDSTN
jgi:hypothetical protein